VGSHVRVPSLIGLTVGDARDLGYEAGIVVVSDDPDGAPLGARTRPGVWVVTGQEPAGGAWCARGDVVTVRFEERGGGAGVREPRRPLGLPPFEAVRLDQQA